MPRAAARTETPRLDVERREPRQPSITRSERQRPHGRCARHCGCSAPTTMLELESQLRRDHALLDAALSTLLDIVRPSQGAIADLRALFTAHVESEAVILRAALTRTHPPPPPFVAFLIAQVTAA